MNRKHSDVDVVPIAMFEYLAPMFTELQKKGWPINLKKVTSIHDLSHEGCHVLRFELYDHDNMKMPTYREFETFIKEWLADDQQPEIFISYRGYTITVVQLYES